MPLVFVHGVNTRYDSAYARAESARDDLFRQVGLRGIVAGKATILNPYWGKWGASFRWNHASLPAGEYERFGAVGSELEQLLEETVPDIESDPDRFFVDLARVSMERAVDCLFAATALADVDDELPKTFGAQAYAALRYAAENPSPAWLRNVTDNAQFADSLAVAVRAAEPPAAMETFGAEPLWDRVQRGVVHATDAATAFFVNPISRRARPTVHRQVSTFIGDVMAYLASREDANDGEIINVVRTAFRDAAAVRKDADDLLIVVAHSLGGVISYDVLTSYAADVHVDVFVTVGSQVGMFEELKLYRKKDLAISGPQKVPRLPNVGRWINVMDPNDPLGYAVAPIFDDAKDTVIDLHVPVWAAHTAYFARTMFHDRLRERIKREMR